MHWLPSDPKLAREASSIFAEMELAAQIDTARARPVRVSYDLLGRLLSIRLPVVPEDFQEFYRNAVKFAEELPASSVAHQILDRILLTKEESEGNRVANSFYQMYWLTRWHSLGCPAVTLESKLAASLMATETAAELVAGVKPPWDCFILRLPRDLVDLGRLKFTHLVVHRHVRNYDFTMFDNVPDHLQNVAQQAKDFYRRKVGPVWGLYGMSGEDLHLMRNDRLAELLGKERIEYLISTPDADETPDDRLVQALARLVVGVCQMAENPNAIRRKSTKKQQHRRWRFSKLPLTTEYVLAPDVPIKFDCTEAIGAYLRGDRKTPPRIQYVVRGHWRNQAHGPGRIARKRIWIQPYWKGPEDVPRLFREHRFDGKADGVEGLTESRFNAEHETSDASGE